MIRRNIAQIVSYLFHPLAMPIYALFLFYFTDPYFELFLPSETKLKALMMFLGLTFIGPLILLSVYRYTGTINNFSDPNRSSRIMVAVVVLLFYFTTYFLFKKLYLSQIFYDLFLSIIISICIATFISFFYKISMHGLAVGGICGAQLALFIMHGSFNAYVLMALILLCGTVGTSRLILRAHSADQVYTGTLLGIFSVGLYLLFKADYLQILSLVFDQSSCVILV
ncbi:MAG: hypothetical protein AAF487_03415 [Bacteroidota bacterium]